MKSRRALLAELLGTFGLVFAGTGAIVFDQMTGAVTHVGVAITFGLVVMSLIYALGHVSGAHFNPAVTVAFAVGGRFPRHAVPGYLAAQPIGAALASGTLRGTVGLVGTLDATVPATEPIHSVVLEFVMTFFLMLVVMGSAADARAVRGFAGIAIGGTVGLEAMCGGPISGASMNPARSFGPALVSGTWQSHWVYWAAPLAGAALAAWVYQQVLLENAGE